jgi:hypothetical protein
MKPNCTLAASFGVSVSDNKDIIEEPTCLYTERHTRFRLRT